MQSAKTTLVKLKENRMNERDDFIGRHKFRIWFDGYLNTIEDNRIKGDFIGNMFKMEIAYLAALASQEPVGEVGFDGVGEQQATAIKWLTDYRPKKGDKLYTSPQAQPDLQDISQYKIILSVIKRVLWTAGATKQNQEHLAEAIDSAMKAKG
jgi:hypothetical protein